MSEKTIKKKLILKKQIKQLLSKIMITSIIFLLGMILVKQNPSNKVLIQKNVYEENIKFVKFKELYKKYFGNLLSINNIVYEDTPVFKEQIEYYKITKYKDGAELIVQENYMVPSLENGIVVYIGEKEEYGQTIIIEQENGIDVFYSNVNTNDINLYDYVKKGDYIAQTKTNKLYLIFQKNGDVLNYKDYI